MKPHPLLLPLSWLYGAAVWLRNMFFDIGVLQSTVIGVPIISVGNISAGGTGKTPIVENIAALFIDNGKKVAVLSRGYGRKSKGQHVVCDGKEIFFTAEIAGDEPYFLASRLKKAVVIVDEDRVRAAKKAVDDFSVDIIVLDDGFQHRFLYRDINIVLMNSLSERSALLPAGYNREPLSSLQRADAIVLTQGFESEEIRKKFSGKFFSSSYEADYATHVFSGVKIAREEVKKKTAVIFSGIAHPENFEKTINGCEIKIIQHYTFRDHHQYTEDEITELVKKWEKYSADILLTTEKDAVKLEQFKSHFENIPLYKIEMKARIKETRWNSWLLERVQK